MGGELGLPSPAKRAAPCHQVSGEEAWGGGVCVHLTLAFLLGYGWPGLSQTFVPAAAGRSLWHPGGCQT